MVLVLRGLTRLVTFALLLGLAAAGAAAALFSVAESGPLSLPGLARLLGLPELADAVGRLLGAVEASGPPALVSAVGGLAAIAAGVLLLVGALAPARERFVLLENTELGRLAAQRRPLAQIAGALAEQARGVTASRVRVRPARRRRGGRLAIRATHSPNADRRDVHRRALAALEPLTSSWGLKTRIGLRPGGPGKRVQ